MPVKNLISQVFGRLTVISEAPRQGERQRVAWNCICICGSLKTALSSNLLSGNVQSCGCLVKDGTLKGNYKHGLHGSPLYNIWKNMLDRCENENCSQYKWYGARGISVCDEWHDLEKFISDMGIRPHGFQIDRNDNNGNYNPENCRWSSRQTQCNNRRTNTFLTCQGETHTVSEWSRLTGIGQSTILNRINRSKWTVERALGFSHPSKQ